MDHYNGDPDTPHLILEDLCDSSDHVLRSVKALLEYAEEHPNKVVVVVLNEFMKIPVDADELALMHNEFEKHDSLVIATTNCAKEPAIRQFLELCPCPIRIPGRNGYKCVKATLYWA